MTLTEKAIRDFCGHHADWWPSTTQVQEMLALAQPCPTCEALARTVMLDQTSHDNFKPDWDAMAVMVEEQQRMAKRIEELETEQDSTYTYASSLATTIWQKHYIKESPKFALLDTTEGVLTQIDNMTCCLVKENLAQPEQEPVAIRYDFDGYGYQYIDSGTGSDWQTRVKGEPLYTAPQPEQGDKNENKTGN